MQTPNIDSKEALRLLREGNQRFTSGVRSVESIASAAKLAELAEKGQAPFAIILTCSDSRVPAEILFDRGVGDLFVIRVAGNVVAPSLLASIEFAATSFNTPLCLVMGHTRCGAIKSTIECERLGTKPPTASLGELIGRIRPALSGIELSGSAAIEKATHSNIQQSVRQIVEQSPALRELVQAGRFEVIGALCDISTGEVSFDTNVTASTPRAVAQSII